MTIVELRELQQEAMIQGDMNRVSDLGAIINELKNAKDAA